VAAGARRPARVLVDLGAIAHNARVLASLVAPARLCAVVKADAYGHGAVESAAAALAGGASELAVALVDEGAELRDAGIDAPILVLSEPGADAMADVYSYGLVPTIYSLEGLALATKAARGRGRSRDGGPAPVEIKLDTGMHRVGVDPGGLGHLARLLQDGRELELAGLWTHLAVADETDRDFTARQLERLRVALRSLESLGISKPRRVHAANTAGAIAWPSSRLDMVRCGIGLYGYCPSPAVEAALSRQRAGGPADDLRPALSLSAQVSLVRDLKAGEAVSYGLTTPLTADSRVATVPLGYGDGIPRSYLTGGGEVLVNGRRRRLAGSVTMDQIMVDCEDDAAVAPGDEVVLIGRQGADRLTANDWARALDTICYEVVTRIGPRVPRSYVGSEPGPRDRAETFSQRAERGR
jgi:alanine racemase